LPSSRFHSGLTNSARPAPAWASGTSGPGGDSFINIGQTISLTSARPSNLNLRSLCDQQNIPVAYNGRVIDFTSVDDRFTAALDAISAERQTAGMSERILRGVRGAAAVGAPHGRPPWGYRRKDGLRVREAVERVLVGESRRSVLRWLQSTGYAPASARALSRAILNPQMAGKRVHRGEIGDGTSPAIITVDQHRQLVAASKAMPTQAGPESRHLCTGIANFGKCGKCGKAVRFRGRKALYVCPSGCDGRLVAVVDREVEKAVRRRLQHQSRRLQQGRP
jgi:hypothetical protein